MKEPVYILGLFRSSVEDIDRLAESRVWALNDWYQFYPEIRKPERVFNIHFAPHVHASPHRFQGDWKQEYINSGAKLMVSEMIEGIPDDRQEEVPVHAMTEAGWKAECMTCSISLMLQYAGYLGEEDVRLAGVRLRDDEYRNQLLGIRGAIEACRKRGVAVHNPFEVEWQNREALVPDYTSGQDQNVGSVIHIMALLLKQRTQKLRANLDHVQHSI